MKKMQFFFSVLSFIVAANLSAQDPAVKKSEPKKEDPHAAKYTDEEIRKMKLERNSSYGSTRKAVTPYTSAPQGGPVKLKIEDTKPPVILDGTPK